MIIIFEMLCDGAVERDIFNIIVNNTIILLFSLLYINIVYHLNVFNKKANHEMCYKMKFQIGFLSANILVVYIL